MNLLDKRKEIVKEINKIEVSNKERIITICFSFIITLVMFSGFVALAINLYIFNHIRYFACFLATTFLGLIFYVTLILYNKGITKGNIKNIYLVDLPFYIILQIILYIMLICMILGGLL